MRRFYHNAVLTWSGSSGGSTGGGSGSVSIFGDGTQQWHDVDWRLPKPSQSSETVINVSTNTALQNAVNSASPGDTITITASGTYDSALVFEGVNGTAANPIIVTAAPGVTATIKSDGGIYSFGFGEGTGTSASYIYVGNFQGDTGKIIATGLRSNNTTYRDSIMWFGNKDDNGSNFGLVHHIYITGVEATACKGAMIDIARESSYIEFHGCEFHDVDGVAYGGANPQFCEVFYIGSSATKTTNYGRNDGSHHITIKGCQIHDFTGEAIDNKSGSGTHDITIEDCLIYNGDIYNQTGSTVTVGAVVTGSDDTSYFASGNHNFVVRRCAIWDIQLGTGSGAQIAAGITMQAPATIDTVVIWNTQDEGMRIRDLIAGKVAGDEYTISNVTIFNTGGTDSIDEYGDAGNLTSYLTIQDTIATIGTAKGTQTNNHDPVGGDFIGPLTADAVASGFTDPGTGYRLDSGSSIPDTAGAFTGLGSSPSDWRGVIPRGSSVAPYGGSFNSNGWWLPPAYPAEPTPLGSGTRRTAANATELNAILTAGLVPGDVIVLTGNSYVDVQWSGGAGTSSTQQLDATHTGNASAPVVFYSQSQWSAVFTKTTSSNGSVMLATDSRNNYLEWWGVDFQAGSRSVCDLEDGTGTHLKWCRARSNLNQPCIRHKGATDSGVWFCDIENSSQTSQAEGYYIGWGSDASLYEQNGLRAIGNVISRSAGGCIDLKSNSFDFVAEYNVIDADDSTSGGCNINNGMQHLSGAQAANVTASEIIFRNNIVKVRNTPGETDDGDSFRVGGPCTLENNILFATAGEANVDDGIFCFTNSNGYTFDVFVNNNRMYGFNRAISTSSTGTSTWNIISSNNRATTNLNGLSGSVVTGTAFVGPLTGDAIADASAPLGGLGTGLEMVGSSDPYDVT